MKRLFLVLGFLPLIQSDAIAQIRFNSFDAVMSYASQQSMDLKKSDIDISEAKKGKLVSILDAFEPTGNISFGYTNNTKLPVTLIPSELLGGSPGSFQRVQFGLQYETQYAFSGEVKLINLSGWQSIRRSGVNTFLADIRKIVLRNSLYENLANVYYNVLTLQAQKDATQRNLQVADTILQNILMRFAKGLIKQQEVNDARINLMILEQSVQQITYAIQQQYQALRLLSDSPDQDSLMITEVLEMIAEPSIQEVRLDDLEQRQAKLNEKLAMIDLKKQKYAVLPTLSLSYFNSEQQFNESARLFDSNVSWIPSSYIGLRLVMPLPSAHQIAQQTRARHEYLKAQQTSVQLEREATIKVQQFETSYRKAFAKMVSEKAIYELKKDSYDKNYLNYTAGLITLNDALTSFRDMVNAEYNVLSSIAEVKLAIQKIKIRNEIN